MHPDKLDRAQLMSLVEKYGYSDIAAALRERGGLPDPEQAYLTGNVENIDDFSACKITRKEDWVDLYAKPYYFGCEADDRMNATAFGRNNPFGSKLNAIFSSDIGHFDVIDMRHPLPEAYELVEDGHITADDFRDFTFANAVQAVGHAEPALLRGHPRRQRSRRRARRGANPNPRRRRITPAQQRRRPAALLSLNTARRPNSRLLEVLRAVIDHGLARQLRRGIGPRTKKRCAAPSLTKAGLGPHSQRTDSTRPPSCSTNSGWP